MKKILYGREAREKLLSGIEKMARAVGTSLGPLGRNAGLDRGFEKIVIHDGVTIAENFQLEDEFENFGAMLLLQAAQNQVHKQGDGTTVTTILAKAITKECMRLIEAGENAMILQKGIEKAVPVLIGHLKDMTKPIKTEADKIRIATIASNNTELGEKIGKIIHKLGVDGVISVEESKGTDTIVEHQEGMQFGPGFASPYFITDIKRQEATVENPYIIISDKNIDNIMEFMPFTQKLLGKPVNNNGIVQFVGGVTRNIVLIAPDFATDVLSAGIATKMQGVGNILCVRAPLFGEAQRNLLKDIAILTGGTVVGNDLGTSFENMDVAVCGHAKRVTATKDATMIIGGQGDFELIKEHVEGLKDQLDKEESSFLVEKLKERIGKLTSGVAVIKVGGQTEVEIRDSKEWTIDAIASTKSAIEGGIVPGGEVALLNLSLLNESQFPNKQVARILKQAFKEPFKKLLENAGLEYAEVWQDLADKGVTYGVDVVDGKVKDMIESGIIDPALVVRSAIENSISVSIKAMTSDVLIVNENPKPQNQASN